MSFYKTKRKHVKNNKIKTITLSNLLGNTPETIRNWIEQKRHIIVFLNKYFTNDDIKEYLQTNSISRMDDLVRYDEIYSCLKNEISVKFDKVKKEPAFVEFGLFLATLNKNDYALYSLSEYNPDMFAELLIEFNNYLLKPKKKDFIKILAEVESFYDSLGGNMYKYYFHKEFMWALALKK